jgi:hypothetical protein
VTPLRIDAAVAGVQTAAERRHQRFCHLGFDNMKGLVKEDMVKGLPISLKEFEKHKSGVCKPYVMGKH